MSNLTWEELHSVCKEFVHCCNPQSCKYSAGFRTSLFACQKYFCTCSSLREWKCSMFFYDQSLTERNHKANAQDTSE